MKLRGTWVGGGVGGDDLLAPGHGLKELRQLFCIELHASCVPAGVFVKGVLADEPLSVNGEVPDTEPSRTHRARDGLGQNGNSGIVTAVEKRRLSGESREGPALGLELNLAL